MHVVIQATVSCRMLLTERKINANKYKSDYNLKSFREVGMAVPKLREQG